MKTFRTSSDAGSVRIGNDLFNVLIPNGYGDGYTTVIVGDPEEERAAGVEYKKFLEFCQRGKFFSVLFGLRK